MLQYKEAAVGLDVKQDVLVALIVVLKKYEYESWPSSYLYGI